MLLFDSQRFAKIQSNNASESKYFQSTIRFIHFSQDARDKTLDQLTYQQQMPGNYVDIIKSCPPVYTTRTWGIETIFPACKCAYKLIKMRAF